MVMQVVASEYVNDGSVDIKKQPALKYSTGNWRACYPILGTRDRAATHGNQKVVPVCFFSSLLV
jgi:hypothetical protein